MRKLLNLLLLGLVIFNAEQFKDDFINLHRSLVVKITDMAQTSGGTGFYVKAPSGKLYILTNGHVCRLATPDGALAVESEDDVDVVNVVAQYEDNDLCIIEAPQKHKGAFKLAKFVRNTENIYVLGHPLLEPKTLTKGQLSGGMIVDVAQGYDPMPCEGKTYHKEAPSMFEVEGFMEGVKYMCVRTTAADIVTANILPGNSGSPVLNAYGHVVGVVFAGSPGSGRGFIVPLDDVKDFLKDK